MEDRNLSNLNYQWNDNRYLQQKFIEQSDQLADIKRKWMNLQMEYETLRIKYDEICNATELKLNTELIQKYKLNFESVQWCKTIAQLKQQYENEIDQLRHKCQISIFNKEEYKINLKELFQKMQTKQYESDKEIQSLKKINFELTKKLKQKNKICKILMAKIHSLQSSKGEKQQDNNQFNNMKGQQQLNQKTKNVQIHNDFNTGQNSVLNNLKITLSNQLVKDFFQIFLKSFDPDKKQPSITIFQNNLSIVDTNKMKPYCQCLNVLFGITKSRQIPNKPNLNEKQKWVTGYLQSLTCQRDKKKKEQGSKLIYLFRLSGLYYRINTSIENEDQISPNLIKDIQSQLFKAFYDFFFS